VEAELPYPVTLAQGLPEGSAKMDWIVEKAVELGVAGIVPLAAQRSVVRLSSERADKRLAHWQAVVVSAAEQCGRNRLADVAPVPCRWARACCAPRPPAWRRWPSWRRAGAGSRSCPFILEAKKTAPEGGLVRQGLAPPRHQKRRL